MADETKPADCGDPLHGRRKYRAFLFSLAALILVAAVGRLDRIFIDGLAWILGLFGLTNGVEWAARAYQGKES